MGQVHHGNATTTAAVRRAIQHSQESLRALAKRYGINSKTVAKWKGRPEGSSFDGLVDRRGSHRRSVPPPYIIAPGRLPLRATGDDPASDALFIASLSSAPWDQPTARDTEGDKPKRAKFKTYPIGYFHIDIAEVRTEMGRLYLFVVVDRTSKFAFVQLHQKATRRIAGDFLHTLAATVPYRIHTVLTDNGTHFTDPTGDGWTPEDIKAMWADGIVFRYHSFEAACADLDIEHRLTKPRHPWTNGQVKRMNRTIKEATVKHFHYETHDQLRQHLSDFVAAYNFDRRLKTLRGLTPYEFICQQREKDPSRFIQNPHHQILGLNI
ncbi:Integrase core domain protein [Komagataeibacter rhaeticus]|nr:Integrase core domain protein [Komagataeibacter rhaeticus]